MLAAGTLLGNYSIVRMLGSGGMAQVYEADDRTLHRRVALKVLPPEFCGNPQLVQRFEKEVRVAASLNHSGIVTVFEVGVSAEIHYYSMRLLTGGDLRQRIHQGLSDTQALWILREVADAFVHAHAAGLVHRDVKPENILFDEQGRPVLTDFGIAKAMSSQTRLTAAGTSIGTPRYLSPEQARGGAVDARADLYSLGVTLFEMLTGQAPYDAEDPLAVIFKHLSDPIPRLPDELAQYQSLIDALMAKEPSQRLGSAAELLERVDALLPAATDTQPRLSTRELNRTGAANTMPTMAASLHRHSGNAALALTPRSSPRLAIRAATRPPSRPFTAPRPAPSPPPLAAAPPREDLRTRPEPPEPQHGWQTWTLAGLVAIAVLVVSERLHWWTLPGGTPAAIPALVTEMPAAAPQPRNDAAAVVAPAPTPPEEAMAAVVEAAPREDAPVALKTAAAAPAAEASKVEPTAAAESRTQPQPATEAQAAADEAVAREAPQPLVAAVQSAPQTQAKPEPEPPPATQTRTASPPAPRVVRTEPQQVAAATPQPLPARIAPPATAALSPAFTPGSSIVPAEFAGMVEAHNRWRQDAGVPALSWSQTNAGEAQRWADQLARENCQMRFNPDPARKPLFRENMLHVYASAPYQGWRRTPDQVVDRWGEAAPLYDSARRQCRAMADGCTQYAQVVADNTRYVGCGRARCDTAEVWVCSYSPPRAGS